MLHVHRVYIVSHLALLALSFYAAKKPELHSNKKMLLLMMNLDTNFTLRESAREHLLLKSNRLNNFDV